MFFWVLNIAKKEKSIFLKFTKNSFFLAQRIVGKSLIKNQLLAQLTMLARETVVYGKFKFYFDSKKL